jgi:hypothetical protein
MTHFRKELQVFIAACETIIALHARKELTEEERALLQYYLKELPALFDLR